MKSIYDVVVIGAGPAGSTAARRAAEAGLSVLLVEKRQEIGVPVRCAEAIGADLCKPFIEPDERWIDAHIERFGIVNSQGVRALVPAAEPTLVVNRKLFDFELALLAARSGAEVRAGMAAVGLVIEDGSVCGARLEWFGREELVRSSLVIAADGSESQAARWAGIQSAPALDDYYQGIEFLIKVAGNSIEQVCEYHLDKSLAPGGYLWVFPKGRDTANVGLVLPGKQKTTGAALASLEQFIARRFSGCSILGVIGGAIPISGALRKMTADGFIATGDAAHQADPLTAGGINLGMLGAEMAARVAVEAIQVGDVSARRLKKYEELWQERFGRMHGALYKFRKVFAQMDQKRIDGMIQKAAGLPLEKMSLSQILLELLKNDPLLLLEARTLITTGLILK